jgi:hypothetical protein
MKHAFAALAWAPLLVQAVAPINDADFAPGSVIERDVAILGGGASGSYAAVRLREDFGRSVVVIEPKDHLVRIWRPDGTKGGK